MHTTDFRFVIAKTSRLELERALNYVLDLLQREHFVAATHSQRNAYQAVIRIELENLRTHILEAADPCVPKNDDVPF